jgi:adenylylsulfate kinase-like enzyme
MRAGLSSDLGFSAEARLENHRRLAEVAKLISDQGVLVVVASMAPLLAHRTLVEAILGDRLRWVHVDASLETCMQRDPKRLYQRARAGAVPLLLEFPFEAPVRSDRMLHLVTDAEPVERTAHRLIEWANARP